jgi:hypothetical protein
MKAKKVRMASLSASSQKPKAAWGDDQGKRLAVIQDA